MLARAASSGELTGDTARLAGELTGGGSPGTQHWFTGDKHWMGWGHSTELPLLVFPGWGWDTTFSTGEHPLPPHRRLGITATLIVGYAAVT